MEALKARLNQGLPPAIYYMRDKSGIEVDLAAESHRRLRLFEIKSARTPDDSMTDNIKRLLKLSKTIDKGAVLYAGTDWTSQGYSFVPFAKTEGLLCK